MVAEAGVPRFDPGRRLRFARLQAEESGDLRTELVNEAIALKGHLGGRVNTETLNRHYYGNYAAKLVEVSQLFGCSSYSQIFEIFNEEPLLRAQCGPNRECRGV